MTAYLTGLRPLLPGQRCSCIRLIASHDQVLQLKLLDHLWRAGPGLTRYELNEFAENAREGASARGGVKFGCLVGSEQRNHVREKTAAGELGGTCTARLEDA